MTMKKILFLVVINVIPSFIVLSIILDLYDAIVNPGLFPFGSEFFSPYSIYKHKRLFIAFNLVELLSLVMLIVTSILRKWKLYYVLLVISIVLIIYRMIAIQ
ncbi:hypothetical protein SAMN05421761_12111 [Belliella pelovolcani]|uniref:Uncharacterized protein n=1 Tax=Belliella pelovolcani TaxID=529505 RepID=A0A1N7PUN9_9BACT|nr:hypothetical protein SAMN05421761_12111 [Belliella pelovolcani]